MSRSKILLVLTLLLGLTAHRAAAVELTNLVHTYDGTPKAATVTGGTATSVTYQGTSGTTYGPSTNPPTNAGNYIVTAIAAPGSGSNDTELMVINKANQTITFNPIGDTTFNVGSVALNASTTSGLAIVFNVISGPVSLSGNSANFTGVGAVTIRASQGGNTNYNAATPKDVSFTINKAPATITLAGLTQTFDNTPRVVTATTSPSGKAVTITYNGGATAPTNAGSYAIVATINDSLYQGTANATLTVNKANATITFDAATLAQGFNNTPRVVTATTTPTGLPLTITYNGGATAPTAVGSYAVVATVNAPNHQGTNNATLVVSSGTQTITFPQPASVQADIRFIPVAATASSGLPITYTVVSGPATIVSNKVKPTGAGSVVIRASQPGNASIAAAAPVERTVSVTPKTTIRIIPVGDSITQGGGGLASYREPLIRILRGQTILFANTAQNVYDTDFMGSLSSTLNTPLNSEFPNSLALDPEHEGHSGWTTDQLLNGNPGAIPESGSGKLSDWIAGYTHTPDIVLLHTGNNDVVFNRNDPDFAADTRAQIGAVIDAYKAEFPNLTIFLAKIIAPRRFNGPTSLEEQAGVAAVNATIDALAAQKNAAAGSDFVYVVDQNSSFKAETMTEDGIHPNTSGAETMAAIWFISMRWRLEGSAPPSPVDPPQKRILMLGDEITQGGFGSASYRDPLIRLLRGENIGGANPTNQIFDFETIGTLNFTYDYNPYNDDLPESLGFMPRHEGHATWTIGDVLNGRAQPFLVTGAGSLPDWVQGYKPDIVLLHLGSNDARNANSSPTFLADTRNRLSTLINVLRADNPSVIIYLAKLIPGGWVPGPFGEAWEASTNGINNFMVDLAAEKNAPHATPFVFVVDMPTGFDRQAMLLTDLQTNDAGSRFMALKWYDAIKPFLSGGSLTPSITSALTANGVVGTPFSYQILASGAASSYSAAPLPAGLTINPATGLISGTPTVNTVANVTIGATNAAGTSTKTLQVTIGSPQTITFAQPPDTSFGAGTLGLTATATSGLPVTFSVVSGPATISGNLLTFTGAGALTVRASQAGNANFIAAPNVDRTFNVTKAPATVTLLGLSQAFDGSPKAVTASTTPGGLNVTVTYAGAATPPTNAGTYAVVATVDDPNYAGSANGSLVIAKATQIIAFDPLPETTFGAPPITLSALASSGLPVSFSVVSGPATIAGNTVTTTGGGLVVVQASQAGNANFAPAGNVNRNLVVAKAAATVTLGNLSFTFDGSPKSATATTVPVGQPVEFTYDGSPTPPTSGGAYAVVATINSPNFAGSASGTMTIAKVGQTIDFGVLSDVSLDDKTVTLVATATSGLPVQFTVVSGNATVAGNLLTLTGAGPITVRASQPGNSNYNAAPNIQRIFSVAKGSQTITFPQPANVTLDLGTVALSATSNSGLAVTYTILSGPATVAGNTVTLSGTGTVSVRAAQNGDANYNPAASVDRSFTVTQANATVQLSNLSQTFNGSPRAITTTTNPAGLTVQVTYNGSTTAPTNAGSYNVVASITSSGFAGSTTGTLVVAKGTATVTLSGLVQPFDGSPKPVTATTTPAGLTVNLTYDGSPTAPSARGSYAVAATVNDTNYTGSANGTLVIGTDSRLVNIAARAQVGTGNDLLIPGFVISGTGTKRVLVRAVGPTLATPQFGVQGALGATSMRLFQGSTLIGQNTGWGTAANAASIASTAATVGGFALPVGSADSAMLVDLAPGGYTVVVSGVNNTTGVALVEVYDADATGSTARLVNIAARAQIGTGNDILIPGYVVGGQGPRRLLIRGIGPSLAPFTGSSDGLLVNPALVVKSGGTTIAENDDWGAAANAAEIAVVTADIGAFELPAGSKDAVVLITVNPGPYTVQMSGVGNTTGVGLVEIYEITD